jgi:hypothetical protein
MLTHHESHVRKHSGFGEISIGRFMKTPSSGINLMSCVIPNGRTFRERTLLIASSVDSKIPLQMPQLAFESFAYFICSMNSRIRAFALCALGLDFVP